MLKQIQEDFLTAFSNKEQQAKMLKHIHPSKQLAAKSRLAIYQDSITECLANALRETYKKCEKLVGEDFFYGLAYTYIEAHPSTSPDLGDYGEKFAEFVEQFPSAKQLPYLADMCRLCWSVHDTYRNDAAETLNAEALASLPAEEQENIVFLSPKNSYLLSSNFPIYQIWQFCKTDSDSLQVDLNHGSEKLFIWRNELSVQVDLLKDEEWRLLHELKQEKPINHIQKILKETAPNIDIAHLLPVFLAKGWLETFKMC